MSYLIGVCLVDELDGSQEALEIPVNAKNDEEAVAVFEDWKKAHPHEYNNAPIYGEPVLINAQLRRVA